MKKLSLAAIAFYLQILAAYSQAASPADSSKYKHRQLSVSEVNLVSGYYSQSGNNSAVTGGVGTEKLTDISNTVEVKLSRYDKHLREHTMNVEIGIDHYSSASSDNIDPYTISSASSADTRFYPSVGYSIKNENGLTLGASTSFSREYDYTSTGFGLNLAKASKDGNRELSLKLQAYLDSWKVILPIELRPNGRKDEGATPRNSYSASLAFSQVVNQRFQYSLLLDLITQSGLLGTSYQRVFFDNGSENYERLPTSRFKVPIGMRANYFISDRIILRSSYRYYIDDWGVKAHTAELEVPVKLTPFFSVSPFYRYYTQTAADYFAAYKKHYSSAGYYTSDYDLSKFNSGFLGAGFRFTPEKGVLRLKHWSMLEVRYGRYSRSNGLAAHILSLHARFK
ncbi:MAG: hypothetical protein JWP88_1367 [Flaviaesturariibacter sp.]|nr:hypothetical protein [Flaviaesturariibacter sp.]